MVFFFQAEDGIRGAQESRGLGDVYKRQHIDSTWSGRPLRPPAGSRSRRYPGYIEWSRFVPEHRRSSPAAALSHYILRAK